MANLFTLRALMALATKIGANPSKFMGTKTNISFLGKGPTKNPLFQRPLAGLENATIQNLGKPETLVNAVEDAMGFATAGKLNTIQKEILGKNLTGINKILNPPTLPKLPSAKIMTLPQRGEGIGSLKGVDPRDTILPMQRLKGRPSLQNEQFRKQLADHLEDRLRGPGTKEAAAFLGAADAKTGMARGIARQILLQDKRLDLPDVVIENLYSQKGLGKVPGGMDPLDLMKKYYGRSTANFDNFLNQVNLEAAGTDEFAQMVLKHIKLTPQFAEGGLANIMQAPRRGRVTHPGGYAGIGKRQAFIDLFRAGGSRQDFINLANSYGVKDPFEALTIHDMLMSGALPSELKHGGLAKILEVS